MESPLSIFEAVFKVIEDRVPFGRKFVTVTSVLMMAVVVVFALEFLFSALTPPVVWLMTLVKTRSVPPLPRVAQIGEHVSLGILIPIVAYLIYVIRASVPKLTQISGLVETISGRFETMGGQFETISAQQKANLARIQQLANAFHFAATALANGRTPAHRESSGSKQAG